jgi:hypothetical protein
MERNILAKPWKAGLNSGLCIALYLGLAPLAHAQTPNMIYIGKGAGGDADVYFLPDTFKQIDSRTRSAEIIFSYHEPRLGLTDDLQDDPNQKFTSLKSTYFIHCADGTVYDGYLTQYLEPKGAGVVVGKISGGMPQEAWYLKPIDLYSAYPMETTIPKTICDYKAK